MDAPCIHPLIHLSLLYSLSLSVFLSVSVSLSLYISLPLSRSYFLPLSIFLAFCPLSPHTLYLSFYLQLVHRPSIYSCQSMCLAVYVSVHVYVCLCVSLCLLACLPISRLLRFLPFLYFSLHTFTLLFQTSREWHYRHSLIMKATIAQRRVRNWFHLR